MSGGGGGSIRTARRTYPRPNLPTSPPHAPFDLLPSVEPTTPGPIKPPVPARRPAAAHPAAAPPPPASPPAPANTRVARSPPSFARRPRWDLVRLSTRPSRLLSVSFLQRRTPQLSTRGLRSRPPVQPTPNLQRRASHPACRRSSQADHPPGSNVSAGAPRRRRNPTS
eukprot:156346-Chlamydomonas_euryale.AAC.2